MGVDCNTFDVVVGVIDRWDESSTFVPFVGMLVGSCFKGTTPPENSKLNLYTVCDTKYYRKS